MEVTDDVGRETDAILIGVMVGFDEMFSVPRIPICRVATNAWCGVKSTIESPPLRDTLTLSSEIEMDPAYSERPSAWARCGARSRPSGVAGRINESCEQLMFSSAATTLAAWMSVSNNQRWVEKDLSVSAAVGVPEPMMMA